MDVYERLRELGISLPPVPPKAGIYAQSVEFGEGLVYVSGCGPDIGDGKCPKGRLGQLSPEQGQEAARRCALNALAVLHQQLGDLNRIRRFVKLLTFVASTDSFFDQPLVANGGSRLLAEVFGEQAGVSARSAIGVNVLPGNIPVETELLVELHGP